MYCSECIHQTIRCISESPLRAGGFRVDKKFGLRLLVVDRSMAAGRGDVRPTGISNVVQMFETAQVQCARHSLEVGQRLGGRL